jgi:glycosyltransferase involved in cell wall biosynthesis
VNILRFARDALALTGSFFDEADPSASTTDLLSPSAEPKSRAAGTRRLTIAMVAACPFPAPRGTPIRILRMAEALAVRGHRVHVVTYHYGEGAVDPRVTVHRIPAVTGYRRLSPGPTLGKLALLDPLLGSTLFRFLRREQVDVIHAHHFEGLIVAAAVRLGRSIPLVFDVHTLLGSELPTYALGLPRKAIRIVGRVADRRLPGLADHVIACSELIRDKLAGLQSVAHDRMTVIPNGVELGLFDVSPRPNPAGRPTLVFAGNLAQYQGIDLMLAALRRVLDRRPDVRLKLVTAGDFGSYETQARQLGVRDAIELLPAAVEDMPDLLAAADVALNPRVDCDGIPVKLLNYMAAGRPIVSFAGSAPGLTHRDNAWLAEDGDIEGFADGVLRLLDEPELAEALGAGARRFVELNHSWGRSAELIEAVYARLAGCPDPSR